MKVSSISKFLSFRLFAIAFLFLSVLIPAHADEDAAVRSECFGTLKENMAEIGMLARPELKELKDADYSQIEGKFSRYYKNASSFGIDVDSPVFEMRLYSFGRQTGYVHPPMSPFPSTTQSEKWDSPAKEFIVAEEYVKDPSGKRLFLSCAFMRMTSEDLSKVKSENYWRDAQIISLLKKSDKLDYKAWWNENISLDYEGNPFVTWYRLFVYPEKTKNDYFDRYTVADSFPGNVAENFDALKKKSPPADSKGDGFQNRIYVLDENGTIVETSAPPELRPVTGSGNDAVFPLFGYYQSVENAFPEFSKRVALRGVVHFDVLKDALSAKDDGAFARIWNTVMDTDEVTKYYHDKTVGKITAEQVKSAGGEFMGEPTPIQNSATGTLTAADIQSRVRIYEKALASISTAETDARRILS